MLTVVKTAVAVMGALIVAGFILVFVKIADRADKSKIQNVAVGREALLSFGETPAALASCGAYACLLTQGGAVGARLLVIDPDKGSIRHAVSLTETDRTPGH